MESIYSQGNISSSLIDNAVPWVNWSEWNYLRRSIFSSSPKLISSALHKISCWVSRDCQLNLVELTAIIIEIHQKDPFFRGDTPFGDAVIPEKMLNMLYCMFIMRLVNDFVEPEHKTTGRSISDIAEALGIPRTFVDIRHESSHRSLPSLKLVRPASAKALEWLKANYWEPQRIASCDPRKVIKSRLRQMILCLKARQVSLLSSVKNKTKHPRRASLLMPCRKLSQLASKSDGSKAHISKLIRIAVHLYSVHPSDFVSVLLEFFLAQASVNSDHIDLEGSDDSECSLLKPISGSLIGLKMVITKLSLKTPRLLLSMLKAVIEMIEEKDSRNFENGGNDFLYSLNQAEVNQVCHLRWLVLYLIRNLKALKESGQIELFQENQICTTHKMATAKVCLTGLLHKCLSLFDPGDKYMLKSALLLAEMNENKLLTEKLKKLPMLAFLDQNQIHCDDIKYNENMLLKEEDAVEKAAERLDLIKFRLGKHKNSEPSNSVSGAATNLWRPTKSWGLCPIGMLLCSFSSAAFSPIFYVMEDEKEADKSEPSGENVEDVHSADTREMVCDDVEFLGDENAAKKLKQMPETEGSAELGRPFLMEGRLLIGGLWKKVSQEELISLESDVRIFV
ncbi:hypothetical protein KSP39_PZI008564 [Platanthera zijinensis]|uniref:Las1-like family protein n=1 Tax=Platanthera zijinensis TaxID=2320716 RepID=A0AAP0BPA7_9ASPA